MDKTKGQLVKLVQVNIYYGKLGANLVEFLDREKPDIVCMQEAVDLKGHAAGLVYTLDEIKQKTGFENDFMSPTHSFRYMNRQCPCGNCILSRYPITKKEVEFITGEYMDGFDIEEHEYNRRNMQICKVKLPDGKTLTVANHHGYHVRDPEGNDESIKAMVKVAEKLKGLRGPVIFCGDLNVSPDSKAMRPLDSVRLRNLTAEYGLKQTLSSIHKVKHLEIACDYIFTSDDIQVKKFEAKDELVSDHKPLVMEFDV